jgi:AraC-like DNA-binding protein
MTTPTRGGTISVVMVRPAVAGLDARGIDPGRVLRAAGVSREALGAIEHRLAATNVRALWEEASIAAGDPAFGVHVAETVGPGTFDVIDYIFATSADLGSGLMRVTKYIRLVQDPSDLRLVVEPLVARVLRKGVLATPQFDEFAMSVLVVRSRQACGSSWIPDQLRFQHERPGDAGELVRVFGCRVTFGAPQTELVLARKLLDLPFERSDSRLLAILERYAESLLEALPSQGTIVARTAHAIAREMARAAPTLIRTAATLGIPPRTLQRSLTEHGTSHSLLVDEVRRGLALKQIGNAALSLTELGYLLHFSDTTAFYRAFKRWTGRSPRAYRAQLLAGGAP